MTDKKLGIIQSRGLGDIVMSLPIAKHYHDQRNEIYWPVCEAFVPSLINNIKWINWIPMPNDRQGKFFYDQPVKELASRGVGEHLCLYQSLSGHPEFSSANWFQIQKFDEYKYTRAGVPFVKKWQLDSCISRDAERETKLYEKLIKNDFYFVTHLNGSDWTATPDLSYVPSHWQHINITQDVTDNIWDWLTIIENAQALIAIDSVVANIVDCLQMHNLDKYWIPRSHIHLTPVLGCSWTILDPPPDSAAAKTIFSSK